MCEGVEHPDERTGMEQEGGAGCRPSSETPAAVFESAGRCHQLGPLTARPD